MIVYNPSIEAVRNFFNRSLEKSIIAKPDMSLTLERATKVDSTVIS